MASAKSMTKKIDIDIKGKVLMLLSDFKGTIRQNKVLGYFIYAITII